MSALHYVTYLNLNFEFYHSITKIYFQLFHVVSLSFNFARHSVYLKEAKVSSDKNDCANKLHLHFVFVFRFFHFALFDNMSDRLFHVHVPERWKVSMLLQHQLYAATVNICEASVFCIIYFISLQISYNSYITRTCCIVHLEKTWLF